MDDGAWNLAIPEAHWQRGFHRLGVEVWTREQQPQTFRQELAVRYQPPAPKVRLLTPIPEEVNTPKVSIQFEVEAAGDLNYKVRLTSVHAENAEERLIQTWQASAGNSLSTMHC